MFLFGIKGVELNIFIIYWLWWKGGGVVEILNEWIFYLNVKINIRKCFEGSYIR